MQKKNDKATHRLQIVSPDQNISSANQCGKKLKLYQLWNIAEPQEIDAEEE